MTTPDNISAEISRLDLAFQKLTEREEFRMWHDISRFYSKFSQTDGCWLWQGSTDTNGYGISRFQRKAISAHRFSWIIHFGPVPDRMMVCHHCDNPLCVNPDHLFLGTAQDNMDDCVRKGRINNLAGRTTIKKLWQQDPDHFNTAHGSSHYMAKLNEDAVRKIKSALAVEPSNLAPLCKEFGISASAICSIRSGKTWKHVQI